MTAKKMLQMRNMRGIERLSLHRLLLPGDEEATTLWSLTSLRWHYPDQVVRVFLSLHKEGHPESCRLSIYTFARLGKWLADASAPLWLSLLHLKRYLTLTKLKKEPKYLYLIHVLKSDR
jgi:hypothetical protein